MVSFGWSYPAGCEGVPGDEDDDLCQVCCRQVDTCICPECLVCGAKGDPECYFDCGNGHGLFLSKEQRLAILEHEQAEGLRVEAEIKLERRLMQELY